MDSLFKFEVNLIGRGESITKEQMYEIEKQMDKSV